MTLTLCQTWHNDLLRQAMARAVIYVDKVPTWIIRTYSEYWVLKRRKCKVRILRFRNFVTFLKSILQLFINHVNSDIKLQ